MGYTLVKSFEKGIDTRRLIDTTEAGALLEARDCHITLGGELEKRAAFVVVDTLPATTIGLWVTEGRVYHTWGDAATPPAGLPAGTIYHSIPDPDGSPLTHILSVEEFNGGIFVVAQYADMHQYMWWWTLGATPADLLLTIPFPEEVPDPGGGGGTVTPPPSGPTYKPQVNVEFTPAVYLSGSPPADMFLYWIYLLTPTSTYNFGPTGTIDAWMLIPQTSLTPGGRPQHDTLSVPYPGDAGNAMAALIMENVNATIDTPVDVQCQASGNDVLFWIDLAGTAYNGYKLEIRTSATVRHPTMGPYTFSGGIAPPSPPPPSPSPPPPPLPRAGDPGDPIEKGSFAIAHNYRMFAVQGTMLNFSAPKDPTTWDKAEANSGFIDHSMITNRAPHLISMADYGGDLAVFGKRHIFVWNIDVVPSGDFKKQTIHGTGTFAPHSVTPWGQTDIMYLDTSGIRSLRARDSSEQAFSADIGTMIDSLVRSQIAALTDGEKLYQIWGIVDPRTGRLWMALKNKIYVLSFFPSSRVAAWTWYDATDAPVNMMNSSDDSIYWRSGNNVMVYGGLNADEYDDTEALVRLPYIDGGKPATSKNWTGFDAAIYGTWEVRGSFDPTIPAALDLLANITKSTYQQQKIAVNGESPAISLELKTTFVGPARIGNAALHYTDSTAD